MDEAGPKAQAPFIMASAVRESDPDATVVENGIMSPSRTRFGSSRSGSSVQAGAAENADEQSEDEPAADTSDPDDTSGATVSEAGQDTEPDLTSRDRVPTFTPSPEPSADEDSSSYLGGSYAGSSYSGSAPTSSYSSPAYTPPKSYSDSGWSSRQDDPATAPIPAAPAPAATPPSTSSAPGGGFSATAAAAVSGAAAGLANYASSVSSAWQNRGANSKVKPKGKPRATVRQSSKRQAMLTLTRLEPWSVMKFSFVASVVAFIILFVAVAVLYMVLTALGVFDSLQHTVTTITSSKNSAGTNISHWFSASLILGYTAMLGALNIVLITALSTIGSVIYNLIAKTVGGIEVTLRETD